MITEDFIKKEFVHEIMQQGINEIYDIQEEVARTELNIRSGSLTSHLAKKPFNNISGVGREVYYVRVLPYLRFLDIAYMRGSDKVSRHRRAKLSIYNRVVWGVMYGEVFPNLSYGFTTEIRKYIREQLEAALPIDSTIFNGTMDYDY